MAAYAALVSLMTIIDNFQNHPRLSTSLDNDQIKSLAEKLDFLLNFVESYDSHGDEVEGLESQIASAAHAAEDVIESHIVDQLLPQPTLDHGMDQILPRLRTLDHGETSSGFMRDLKKQIKAMKKKVIKVQEKVRSKIDESCRQKEVLAGSTEKSSNTLLQEIVEEMESIKKKVIEVQNEKGLKDQRSKSPMPAASSRPLTARKTTMVGFDSYLLQLLDWLTGEQPDRKVVSITGMGGIGKTTLARNIYEGLYIEQHFDVHAWVTISQEYDVRKIIFEILLCLRESARGMDGISEVELGEQLHKTLSGRRYLIILDDVWCIEAWDKIKFYFPNNLNRSRIIVTTRILNVASHFGSWRLELNLLDDDQSWNVFREKVFGQEICPPGFEEIGKKIVEKCRGLPLSIDVIGGLLGKSSSTQDWEKVAKDVNSILNSTEDNQCLDILSLSYRHLPVYLKPCFLYLGMFPEDHEIRISQLIKLWVAEGFIKPNREQSLEEIAKGYMMDLIDRNLVLVRKMGMTGKLKTCSIHDLLRDLCIKIAKENKLFCVMKEHDTLQDIDRERRIIIHGGITKEDRHSEVFITLEKKLTTLARSVIGTNAWRLLSNSRLLRVLYDVYADPGIIYQQVNLRFLMFDLYIRNGRINTRNLPSSISLLWNVQTLISTGEMTNFVAPSEIWEMPHLRHIKIMWIYLPDPPLRDERDNNVWQNLQTLGILENFRFSEEACKRMPNIKKLHVSYYYEDVRAQSGKSLSDYCLHNVGGFNKLESLRYIFPKVPTRDDLLQNLMLPRSLKKLSLHFSKLCWDDLSIIGSLPHLENLKLVHSVIGPQWNPIEGEFLRLKFLRIQSCDLIYWNADKSHFPVLEKLDLKNMGNLKEIPSDIGEIPTLESIRVYACNFSVAISALRILEEQECLGNEGLHVRVEFYHKEKLEEFKKIVEQESLTSIDSQSCIFFTGST